MEVSFKMTYTAYIEAIINKQHEGAPIFVDRIAEDMAEYYGMPKHKASAAASVAIKRLMDDGKISNLRRFQKGIYYRTTMTAFGELGIDKTELIRNKYMINDQGYITGYMFLYQLGLTTQIPAKFLIATNVAGDCLRYDKRLSVYICPPKARITTQNKNYLQVLDVLDLIDKAPIDTPDPYKLIGEYIYKKGLNYQFLLYLADNYYNKKTVLQLAHTAGKTVSFFSKI